MELTLGGLPEGGGLEWEEQELRWSFHLDILIFLQLYRHNYPISILCNKWVISY